MHDTQLNLLQLDQNLIFLSLLWGLPASHFHVVKIHDWYNKHYLRLQLSISDVKFCSFLLGKKSCFPQLHFTFPVFLDWTEGRVFELEGRQLRVEWKSISVWCSCYQRGLQVLHTEQQLACCVWFACLPFPCLAFLVSSDVWVKLAEQLSWLLLWLLTLAVNKEI